MPEIVVIAHNIRSTHNVGSIFRTCDGFGVSKLILSGYTPYPTNDSDTRLPHQSRKLTSQIHKTALGAENNIPFEHQPSLDIPSLKGAGYTIVQGSGLPRLTVNGFQRRVDWPVMVRRLKAAATGTGPVIE